MAGRKKEKREEQVNVRVMIAQKAAMERAARRVNLDLSSWARAHLLEKANWDPDKDPDI